MRTAKSKPRVIIDLLFSNSLASGPVQMFSKVLEKTIEPYNLVTPHDVHRTLASVAVY